jgi:hypothetical protein
MRYSPWVIPEDLHAVGHRLQVRDPEQVERALRGVFSIVNCLTGTGVA